MVTRQLHTMFQSDLPLGSAHMSSVDRGCKDVARATKDTGEDVGEMGAPVSCRVSESTASKRSIDHATEKDG
jgi:hypothetical protein